MPNTNGYSPYYSPQYQPANWFGDFVGNLGNNWQGGEDQAMYADPNAGQAGGSPYATYQGVVTSPPGQAGIAVGNAVSNVVGGAASFLSGVIRGGGAIVGVAIILMAVVNENSGRHRG